MAAAVTRRARCSSATRRPMMAAVRLASTCSWLVVTSSRPCRATSPAYQTAVPMPSSMASRPPAARRPLSVRKGVRRRQAVEAAHKRSRQVVAVGAGSKIWASRLAPAGRAGRGQTAATQTRARQYPLRVDREIRRNGRSKQARSAAWPWIEPHRPMRKHPTCRMGGQAAQHLIRCSQPRDDSRSSPVVVRPGGSWPMRGEVRRTSSASPTPKPRPTLPPFPVTCRRPSPTMQRDLCIIRL